MDFITNKQLTFQTELSKSPTQKSIREDLKWSVDFVTASTIFFNSSKLVASRPADSEILEDLKLPVPNLGEYLGTNLKSKLKKHT